MTQPKKKKDDLRKLRQAYELPESRVRALEQRILQEASREKTPWNFQIFQRAVPAAACMVLAAGGMFAMYRLTRPGEMPVREEQTQTTAVQTELTAVCTSLDIAVQTTAPQTTAADNDTRTVSATTATVTTATECVTESAEAATQEMTFPAPGTTSSAETQTVSLAESTTTGVLTTTALPETTTAAPQTTSLTTASLTTAAGTTASSTGSVDVPSLPAGCISLEIGGEKENRSISAGEVVQVELRLNQPISCSAMVLSIGADDGIVFTNSVRGNGRGIPLPPSDMQASKYPTINIANDFAILSYVSENGENEVIEPCVLLRFGVMMTGDVEEGKEYHFYLDRGSKTEFLVDTDAGDIRYNIEQAFTLCTLTGRAAPAGDAAGNGT